ncbi:anthranilate synthase component I family protein [Homoserinibacter sp. GY 40078]|uniref:anthranilate synthase component I family protein n=1 Tax=Homoserinibacter sp. GY 40078 TaxID=2603275 RepID=UPI0011CC48C4|nr:anthranilate synthase component I family protein [Homoserinibacter sp. GY 40078]TXK17149.1 anthranilate synthase component I family protein [Homoserinibacter sp. GY 40078]
MRLRLLRHPLGGGFRADQVARVILPDDDAFWLDSGAGGPAFLGTGSRVELSSGAVLPALRDALASMRSAEELGHVPLGLVGWLGYELRGETTGMPVSRRGALPDAAFLRVDRLVRVDPDGSAELLALGEGWTPDLARWRDRIEHALTEQAARRSDHERPRPVEAPDAVSVRWRDSDDDYLARIRACQQAIREGDAYQLCLTTEARVAGRFDPLEVFARVREASPTHHAGLVRIGGAALVSASPERFLEVDPTGLVRTRPIKGTRPRDARPDEDARLRGELVASEKERAENLMIVDLMRNDLSRVSELGSVAVTSLLEVESYRQVHQLVSTIEGRLLSGLGAVDAIEACFPAGSMTGAPKLRAIEILDDLEGRPRGPYAGAFGYLAADGSADLAMTIRTIVIDDVGASVGAGGGITALSAPEDELAEAHLKADALISALVGPRAQDGVPQR